MMCENGDIKKWYPIKYLQEIENNSENYAIVVLNRPIKFAAFPALWNNATIRQCVDGGLDRFINYKKTCLENLNSPHIISGDFDSCSASSMDYAKSQKWKIVHTEDQNETDFTKALRVLGPELEKTMTNSVLVICDTSGRLDQIMANINTLFKCKNFLPNSCEVMILSSNALSFLLSPGSHVIHIPPNIVAEKEICGLVPFTKTLATTEGLKWNLKNSVLEFGALISTSNTYENDVENVKITTDNSLLWTMGILAKED